MFVLRFSLCNCLLVGRHQTRVGGSSIARTPDTPAARGAAERLIGRASAAAKGFDHEDPMDWPSATMIASMRSAPSYRPELDLVAIAPDGEWVSSATFWYEPRSGVGVLEPMSTLPEHRRKGVGRAVIHEGARRLARAGAKSLSVGTVYGWDNTHYYPACGFKLKQKVLGWHKEYA